MFDNKIVAAVIVAAGRGSRMGSDVPKQYMTVAGKTIIDTTLYKFEKSSVVDEIILVVNEGDIDYVEASIACNYSKISRVVRGGATRTGSVYEGIKAAPENCGLLIVHDGVRPFVSYNLISTVVEYASEYGACIPVVDVVDTIKQTEDGFVAKSLDRRLLKAVQTPQAFSYGLIKECYEKAVLENMEFTDDSSVVEYFGNRVKTVEGLSRNIKITTPLDLRIAGIIANIY